MKRLMTVALTTLALPVFTAAQSPRLVTADILGAHLNYGRGCAACHAPHSGTFGTGNAGIADPDAGNDLLWGADVTGLYGKTITTGGGKFVEVLPASMSAKTPDVGGMLTCLGCHDGNYASSSMMKNKVYETLPAAYGANSAIPTLLGSDSAGGAGYLSDHPSGLSAIMECGGDGQWDCSQSNGNIQMNGVNSRRFVKNYGFFMKMGSYSNAAVVVCTTCHEPHVMNVVNVTSSSTSGLPPGAYATMFFLRAPYNPGDSNPASNQTAQFCRQCHAGMSNEMNGSGAGTVF